MNSGIDVLIYSYQNKNLFENIKKNIDSSSKKNKLFFYIVDQNNTDRSKYIDIQNKNVDIVYKYVKWDSIKSPILYKKEFLEKSKNEYYMQCGDNTLLKENWDSDFIEFVDQKNIIISGNQEYEIKNKNLYFIEKTKKHIDMYKKVNLIDRNLLFGKVDILSKIEYPTYLKYFGEEESISLNLIKMGVEIYAAPTDYVKDDNVSLSDEEYVPFSLYHGYNTFIEKNKEIMYNVYNVNLLQLPFFDDDVLYDMQKSKVDKMGGKRYLNDIKVIN
jgi:hypothetical protein